MSPKILVVGCGITGAAVNRYITSLFPTLKPSYTFWERSSSLGGRMITNFQTGTSDNSPVDCKKSRQLEFLVPHCDMGAQYLTRSSDDAETMIYKLLTDSGIITPIIDNTVIDGMRPEHLIKTHFVAPNGLSSVIDFLSVGCNEKKSDFQYDTTLEAINVKYCEEQKRKVFSAVGRKSQSCVEETFDSIILTLPAPQLLELSGDVADMLGATFRDQLSSVVYSSRYAVAFYYSRDSWQALKSIPWSGKYVFDDEIIRYISIESRKANFPTATVDGGNSYDDNGSENGPSILVHTSVPFGINNKDVDEAIVYEMILKHLNLVLPNLGKPLNHHLVNWRESQISKGLNTVGFAGEIKVLDFPDENSDTSGSKRKLTNTEAINKNGSTANGVIVIAGDAFTESNFEGCLRSAKAAAAAIGLHYIQ